MKTWMISILSVMALAFVFTGCGEQGNMVASEASKPQTVASQDKDVQIVNGRVISGNSNPFGLSDGLGVPPKLPVQ
ncbi:hypothetical protein MNB_SM-3-801 [hydrothermal vent metagenome]|uniref:Uncharacterized protein n=1 Tax=hydrothermal vent metagenome TaxID=652676 RepID=A0A1W1D5G6_9ZZZZ